jgi:hypothetical protein
MMKKKDIKTLQKQSFEYKNEINRSTCGNRWGKK